MEANEILRSSYLDLLFDRRNKAYGGYELRQKYARRTRNALIGVLAGTLLLTAIPVLADHFRPAAISTPAPRVETVDVADLAPKDKESEPIPILKNNPPPPSTSTVAAPELTIVDKPDPQQVPPPEDLEDRIAGPVTADGIGDGISPVPGVNGGTGVEAPIPDATAGTGDAAAGREAVLYVDVKASFKGNLYAWLAANLQYPPSEQEAGNSGRVIVEFIVELDGSLSAVRVARSSGHSALDAEALRVVRKMPAWNPGFNKNKPVRSVFKQPITFQLQ